MCNRGCNQLPNCWQTLPVRGTSPEHCHMTASANSRVVPTRHKACEGASHSLLGMPKIGSLLLLLLLLRLQLLVTYWPTALGQQTCSSSCQAAQQRALSDLFTATGGNTWVSTNAAVVPPTGWLNTSSTGTGLPAHCQWTGAGQTPWSQ